MKSVAKFFLVGVLLTVFALGTTTPAQAGGGRALAGAAIAIGAISLLDVAVDGRLDWPAPHPYYYPPVRRYPAPVVYYQPPAYRERHHEHHHGCGHRGYEQPANYPPPIPDYEVTAKHCFEDRVEDVWKIDRYGNRYSAGVKRSRVEVPCADNYQYGQNYDRY